MALAVQQANVFQTTVMDMRLHRGHQARGHGQEHAQFGVLLLQQFGSLQKHRRKLGYFRLPAAGHQGQDQVVCIQTQRSTNRPFVYLIRDGVGNWMPHKSSGNAVLCQQGWFEGKQAQDMIDTVSDFLQTLGPPRPN